MALAGATALAASPARGDPAAVEPSRAELAAARDVFAQAERDEDDGRWQDALDKMRQVALVKTTAGVEYHIALCEEHLGLLVSALADFEQARSRAETEHAKDVQHLVGGALDQLAPRVPRLTLHVTPENVATEVTIDGNALVGALGEARPIDPGAHTIEARAPGWQPASLVVTMHEHDARSIEIPLVAEPPPAPTPPAGETGAPPAPRRAVPFAWTPARVGAAIATATAAGLAGAGVGAYFMAGNALDRGMTTCAAVVTRSPNACDLQKTTVRAWDWAAAGAWAGAALSTGLAVFLWTRPAKGTSSAASVSWVAGPGTMSIRGSF
ncbi:MAG: hypothetical protein FWD17_07745 [Polyangiaceae bacterium]|nr:hypothetical protein [Polyangiaceae bacterium]